MSKLYNVSSGPHIRSRLTTGNVMYNVAVALLPAVLWGVYHFGFHAFLVIAMSVMTAVLTEFVFNRIVRKPNTVKDGSAIVTGLLLALCLPAGVPLYLPFFGSIFAILVVKCLFGGLGHNFMNPALAGRCFLLISFSKAAADYTVDGVSSATPLALMAEERVVSLGDVFAGNVNGVIGCSIAALLLGALYLLITGGITLKIPVSVIVSFAAVIVLFGDQGFDFTNLLLHIFGGGVIMGAFFMATDPVTSPVTSKGQILYGFLTGLLCGIFRLFGSSADSVSYAIIIANLVVPLVDEISVPLPYGYRKQNQEKRKIPRSALILCGITLAAGIALSGVFKITEKNILEQQKQEEIASYKEVLPKAKEFSNNQVITEQIEFLRGKVYGYDFGKAYINEVFVGTDTSGDRVGYVISVTSGDGFEGNITISVGISLDGTVNGIAFTELNETAGLGALCGEDAFKDQFAGVKTDEFILNKAGGSEEDHEIDSVSGASTSSGAIVNAVNAAIDFYEEYIK